MLKARFIPSDGIKLSDGTKRDKKLLWLLVETFENELFLNYHIKLENSCLKLAQ